MLGSLQTIGNYDMGRRVPIRGTLVKSWLRGACFLWNAGDAQLRSIAW